MHAINDSRKGRPQWALEVEQFPFAHTHKALHGSKLQCGKQRWRLVGFGISQALKLGMIHLAERLVGAEAHNGQSKGIHGQFVVLHVLSKDIGDARGPSLSFEFAMIGWIREHLLELNPCRIW